MVIRCFRHQLLLPRPYLVLTKPLRLDIQCQRGASVKIGWKYLDGIDAPICQDTPSGGLDDLLTSAEVGHDALVNLSREEAFQAADDVAFGQATTRRHPPVSPSDLGRQRNDAHSQVEADGCF